MAGPAETWWDGLRQEAELPPPRRRSAAPAALGAAAAILASGGLAWWLSSAGPETYRNSETVVVRPPPPPAPARVAASAPDVEQVRRAYEQIGAVYAASGPDGLERFSDSCGQSLRGDARILDFCLAFDLFADSLRAESADVAGKAQARRLAWVQAALPPGADPDARIAQVRAQMRVVSGVPAPSAPAAQEVAGVDSASTSGAPSAAQPVTTPAVRPAQLAKVTPPRKTAAPTTTTFACRLGDTAADRLVCANAALTTQHRQMRAAYDRALAAGADRLAIDAAQAEWRAARNSVADRRRLADLYARRISELEAAAKAPPRRSPPPEEPPT